MPRGKTYVAARPVDIGYPPKNKGERSEVRHFKAGEVVPSAASFPTLQGLVDNGYLTTPEEFKKGAKS